MFRQWKYKFKRWFFRWITDAEGDIGLSLCGGLVTLLKYKDHTLVYFFRSYLPAGKYQGNDRPKLD